MLRKAKLFTFFSLIIIFCTVFFSYNTFAQTPSPTSTPAPDQGKLREIQDQINDLQVKITDLKNQQKTLSSQIAVMDSQIKLTQLRIDSTKQEITDLNLDIDTADKKIDTLQNSLVKLTGVLINRIVATYEVGTVQPFHVLLSSDNVSNFFTRLNYLKIAQEHDKRLIFDTTQAKNDYVNQKEIFEDKKKKVEALKAQLENYNRELDQEKADKQALFKVTQNSEAVYQQKLQAALAEQRAIQQITAGGGNVVSVGPIKEGDIVAYIINGASPCSSGTHLHFEVKKDGGTQDPSQYLSDRSITFENSPDGSFSFGGSWPWPISDPIYIEQGYGMTYWARIGWYGGGPHTGIDIFSSSSLAVKAVRDGELFRGSIACGGGQLNFVRVDQSDGIQTFYLHTVP
ncbi:MAG: hypothetical protein A2629_01845 [Candidatus Levybacteria bacterium RIFCSPHIGHO2_01_FULL_41_15]|nr:MAG: hypothetical protein A2629_01845 [Candidatus Levybacteria bacterium RIFCSPHIGHO2_01_FULL_41_15]